ncbi:ABC transporter ATP-binding protein [Neomoorella mulderi]|uniref:sn-glycerol-3-phosphate import ATP-binding protein UgpC n=1 Tax=Moorella mulderi DSM 14980 TaxID=1122241 RepID=A0A151AVR2_9FIRM|nr:ABC transporter ATP-binding protein [Moorella mulderi]KYH31745.1 sn-glycerol-3-phosphate import ATP-binding protein UgpC [Moorella mulderi DSM 14980]
MAQLVLEGVSKNFGRTPVLEGLSLEVAKGEFLSFLGPSGCGKTTALRLIAGLLEPDTGSIAIGGRCVCQAGRGYSLPPEERQVGMVFQSYALWPHMRIRENVAYPLKLKGYPRKEIEERVQKMLALVDLQGLEDRYPHQLSGGQQQRVALARALIAEPLVLLLDEPLSNLDAKLREKMRLEIKDIQERVGATVIYVTHDQVEALTMSDRIAILCQGRLQQLDTPVAIYERPANTFVADFVGSSNLLPARVVNTDGRLLLLNGHPDAFLQLPLPAGISSGQEVKVALRPEALLLKPWRGNGGLQGRVLRSFYRGREVECFVAVGNQTLRVLMPGKTAWVPGQEVEVEVKEGLVLVA